MRPARDEATEYWFRYIDRVPDGDILDLLRDQRDSALAQLEQVTDAGSLYRYAPDKWSLRELLGHINDCERLFAFRALWFARGFDSPLPAFDQTVAAAHAESDRIGWQHHVQQFAGLRKTTIDLFEAFPPTGWDRSGIASGVRLTVRALAWIAVGHAAHHLALLQSRYVTAAG
ncbi:MAG TPA: DinB family protein [Gemmatimonadales bacterium]|nr:DinB family protein [Gemmatimonadales bacterium]